MTRTQRSVLKNRVRSNLKFQKKEYRRLASIGSRWHLRGDRLFKAAFSAIRKNIRLYRSLSSKLA